MNCMYANQESSSGCESGWTLYLEEHSTSSISPCNQQNDHDSVDSRRRNVNGKSRGFREAIKQSKYEDDDDEGEDLSMVSDASSGPRPYNLHGTDQEDGHDAVGCFYDESLARTKKMKKIGRDQNRRRRTTAHQETSSSLLDDTASSPFFDFSNNSYNVTSRSLEPSVENVMSYSQGYSTTQFQVRPAYQEHYDFYQASTSGNQLHQNQLRFSC